MRDITCKDDENSSKITGTRNVSGTEQFWFALRSNWMVTHRAIARHIFRLPIALPKPDSHESAWRDGH